MQGFTEFHNTLHAIGDSARKNKVYEPFTPHEAWAWTAEALAGLPETSTADTTGFERQMTERIEFSPADVENGLCIKSFVRFFIHYATCGEGTGFEVGLTLKSKDANGISVDVWTRDTKPKKPKLKA